jgi:hypothetical protein
MVKQDNSRIYEKIMDDPGRGYSGMALERVPPKGRDFLMVDLDLRVKWDDDEKDRAVRIDKKKIKLLLKEDTQTLEPFFGDVNEDGYFLKNRKPGLKHSRRKENFAWQKESTTTFRALFVVPEGVTEFTLILGDILKTPIKAQRREYAPNPPGDIKFELLGAAYETRILQFGEFKNTEKKSYMLAEAMYGKLLKVDLNISSSTRKRLNINLGFAIGLLGENGYLYRPVGRIEYRGDKESFRRCRNITLENRKGRWHPTRVSLLFLVPENQRVFQLTFKLHPVPGGQIKL